MKSTEALRQLLEYNGKGAWLYSTSDFSKMFGERGNTLKATLAKLRKEGFVQPVARGLYEFAYPDSAIGRHVDGVAMRMRRGEAVFESLESAAAKWGIISQVPVGQTMYMTTGREGVFDTKYGRIEFVHTKLGMEDILENTVSRGRGRTRLATKGMTARNLAATGRSSDLIDWTELEDGQ